MDLIEQLRELVVPCQVCNGTGTVCSLYGLDRCRSCDATGGTKLALCRQSADELERLTKENAALMARAALEKP